MYIAADAVTVAHIAAALEWEGKPLRGWENQAKKAIERLFIAWEKYDGTEEHPDAEEALKIALDAFAVTHVAETFEWSGGPLRW